MTISQITVHDLKRRLDAGETPLLIDVRFDDERSFCRIEPSQFIPLPELIQRAGEVNQAEGQLIVVYCHHGVRSLRGAGILMQAGLDHVHSLAGGIEAWSTQIDPAVPRY